MMAPALSAVHFVLFLFASQFVLSAAVTRNIFGCPCGAGLKGAKGEQRRRSKRDVSNVGNTTQDRTSGFRQLDEPEFDDRIVNGFEPNERAWQALIDFDAIKPGSRCGGVIINKRFVLTAAHCICNEEETLPCKEVKLKTAKEKREVSKRCPKKTTRLEPTWDIKDIDVVMGTNMFLRGMDHIDKKFKKTRVQPPKQIIVHECYEDKGENFDIALVKLTHTLLDLSTTVNNENDDDKFEVHPICILDKPSPKQHVYVSGFGYTAEQHGKGDTGWCKTSLNSPRPAKRCTFPFKVNGKQYGGDGQCAKVSLKYVGGSFMQKVKKDKKHRMPSCYDMFKQLVRKKKEDPWRDVNYVQMVGPKGVNLKKGRCYKPNEGDDDRICATCLDDAKPGEPGFCKVHKNDKDGPAPDILDGLQWGFCDMKGGACKKNNNELKGALREVKLQVLTNETCKKKYFDKLKQKFNKEDEICAAGVFMQKYRKVIFNPSGSFTIGEEGEADALQLGNKDSCNGDSGGPLFYWSHQKESKAYLYGLVSRGVGCARPDMPGIYTYVPRYVDWLKDNIDKKYYCTH